MQKEQKQKTLTASQRLEGIEQALTTMDQAFGNVSARLRDIGAALKLLSEKVDAIVQANATGVQVNNEVLDNIMSERHAAELKGKVDDLVNSGVLVAAQEIGESSFFVFRELNAETGKVESLRTQFSYLNLTDEWKKEFKGKKIGDTIRREGGATVVEIEEIYDIVEAPAPKENQ
jgi:prophage DNA circulation protein